jgi:ABC-type Fe3+-siderophore transport system permease subunit
MNFDLRLPIGLMFAFYGVVLSIYGMATNGSEQYARSLGININLVWGLVLLAFGAVMLLLIRKSTRP